MLGSHLHIQKSYKPINTHIKKKSKENVNYQNHTLHESKLNPASYNADKVYFKKMLYIEPLIFPLRNRLLLKLTTRRPNPKSKPCFLEPLKGELGHRFSYLTIMQKTQNPKPPISPVRQVTNHVQTSYMKGKK